MYLVKGVLHNETIRLAVVCVLFDFDLDEESGGLAKRSAFEEVVFLDIYFGTPWGRHVESLCEVFKLFVFIRYFIQLKIKETLQHCLIARGLPRHQCS